MTRDSAAIELLRRSSVFSRISRKYLIFKGFQHYAAGLPGARLLTLDGRSWGQGQLSPQSYPQIL
jgi:hypothetical protein